MSLIQRSKTGRNLTPIKKIAEKLEITEGTRVYSFIRLREVARDPLLLEKIIIPAKLVPNLKEKI